SRSQQLAPWALARHTRPTRARCSRTPREWPGPGSCEQVRELITEGTHDLAVVLHETKPTVLEDRCIAIDVDRGDDLGVGYAHQVLACPRQCYRQVKLGGDLLSRLPDLPARWHPAGIAGGARRGDLGPQHVG